MGLRLEQGLGMELGLGLTCAQHSPSASPASLPALTSLAWVVLTGGSSKECKSSIGRKQGLKQLNGFLEIFIALLAIFVQIVKRIF